MEELYACQARPGGKAAPITGSTGPKATTRGAGSAKDQEGSPPAGYYGRNERTYLGSAGEFAWRYVSATAAAGLLRSCVVFSPSSIVTRTADATEGFSS